MPDQFAAADPSVPTADATAADTDGSAPGSDPAARLHVTGVIVAHDGHPWLPTLLTALSTASRRPDHLVAVDTGSADATRADLVGALGESDVVVAARNTGFGTAVAQALDNVPREQRPAADAWVWLLHDDCAPDPGALEAMLTQAAREPDVAILGPKIRAWPNSRRLTEVGLTLARSGRRERGVDPAERDQGQRDSVHDVLAVNTAGMLIRRDVYDALNGFDPRIVLFGDDIDLCWRAAKLGYRTAICPAAVLYHADAATEQLRPVHASTRPRRQLSRANALYVLLVNASAARLPFRCVRLLVASLVRVLGLLIGKAPTAAWQELRALVSLIAHPRALLAGRRARARTSSDRPPVPVAPLLAKPTTQLRRLAAAVVELGATAGTEGSAVAGGGRHRSASPTPAPATVVPSGLGGDEDEILDPGADPSAWTSRLRQPFVVTMLVLLVVTAIATRDLWSTQLSGGALWPAPEHAGTVWSRYLEPWHGVELGSAQVSPPWLAVMAVLATVLGSQPWLAVAVVLLGAVPLSGATAYLAARSQIEQPWLRAWTAATYGLLPAATGAVAQGRLGTCLVIVLAPVMLLATRRALVGGASVRGSWPAVFAAGLLLAVCGSFVPVVWLVFIAVGLLGAVLSRSLRWLVRVVVIAGSAAALTLPWSLVIVGRGGGQGWRTLFAEPGYSWTGAATPTRDPAGTHLLTWWLHPLGVGSIPLYGAALLLLAALVALARTDRARATFTAWLLVAIAGVTAVVGASVALVAPTGALSAAWPGTAVALVLAGLTAAGAIGAAGAGDRLRARAFSWRQPVALVLVVTTGLVPLATAGWWIVRGAADPVRAQPRAVVPAYIAAAQQSAGGARTLVLRPATGASTGFVPAGAAAQVDIGSYQLLRDDAATFADVAVAPGPADAALVDAALRDVLVDQDQAATDHLARLGVKYIYVTVASSPVAELMDAAPGLIRASAPDGAGVWTLQQPVGPMRVVGTGATTVLAADPADDDVTVTVAPGLASAGGGNATAASGGSGSVVTPSAAPGRRLELAEAHDDRWQATLDGVPLTVVDEDTQTFGLPDSGGTLHVWFDDPGHRHWQLVQLVVLAGVVLLAFPGVGRRTELAAREPQGMGR
jgi:GT2 family glycosyltransferase